jgi:hypothetical protein
MVAPKNLHVDATKKDRVRPARFSKGGSTKTLREVPAEPALRGRTGPSLANPPGASRASGGPPVRVGGLALPAVGGHTGPIVGKGR